MTEIVYGSKFAATKGLSRVEIAKLVRADIKSSLKSGELPAGKYSVKTESYSGGGSINVTFTVADPNFPAWNPARLVHEATSPNAWMSANSLTFRSAELTAVEATLQAMLDAYNFDGSDIQTDYFHVRFYSHVDTAGSWASDKRDAETEKALEAAAVAAAAKNGIVRMTVDLPEVASNDVEHEDPQIDYLRSMGV